MAGTPRPGPLGIVRLYHRTQPHKALLILRGGFADLSEAQQSGVNIRGSYFSDNLAAIPPAYGPIVIVVEVPASFLESLYEEGTDQGYVAYLVTAANINVHRPFIVLEAPIGFPYSPGSRV